MTSPKHASNMDKCGSLIQCPYNKDHFSDPKNFAEHLRDCRREYCTLNASSIKMVRCKHNSRHHVPQMELEFHNQICENHYFDIIKAALARMPYPLADLESPSESDSQDEDERTDSSDLGESDQQTVTQTTDKSS